MKIKVSKKQMKQESNKILKVGYCDLQHLLQGKNPFAYSTRAAGWACDYYDMGNVIISTGYAPIGDSIDYSIIQKYDKKAQELAQNTNGWDNLKIQLDLLIKEFLQEVL